MENSKPDCCGGLQGLLPGGCANMVFPYVAMQCQGAERYDEMQALARGTLFPGLDLPFIKEMQTRMNCENRALCELMALGFAINELGLYLDTHREDKEALGLYRSYVSLYQEGKKRYEASYGPLQQTSAGEKGWSWLDDPWPWEYRGGRK